MIKKLASLCSLSLIFFQGYSQLTKDYKPMESYGTIPAEFNTPIEGRYTTAVKEIDKSDKRITKRDKKDFLLESHNELDLYLKSGHAVFNDEVARYLNKVAETLLVSENVKTNKTKFYPIKFEYSNAFTFNEGAVFVNVGLIARCNNEAELAFILGHEYGHYIKHHSINYSTELKQATRGQGAYRKKNIDDRRALMSRYSKSNEIEADLYGYNLLKKSPYNAKAAITALQGLNDAYDIPTDITFDKKVIEKGDVRIPKAYLLENRTDTIQKNRKNTEEEENDKEEEDEDDSFTHPSVEDRINGIWNAFAPGDTIGKKNYVNPKTEFEYVRELCRFEMCRIYLTHNNLGNAFYLISSLLDKYPDNLYLNRMMSATLYRMAKASNDGNLSKFVPAYAYSTEDVKETNYLIHKFKKEELTLVALRYAWDVRVNQPNSIDAVVISDKLLDIYTGRYKQNLNLFANAPGGVTDASIDSLYLPEKETPEESDKDVKGKKKKKTIKKTRGTYQFEKSMSYYALSDLKTDQAFIDAFNASVKRSKGAGKYDKDDEKEEAEDNEETTASQTSKSRVDEKKKKDKNERVHIDAMILLEPDFELTDERKKVSRNYVANEEKEAEIRTAILECSDKAGVEVNIMNANGIQPDETQKMNDYFVLKEFVYEFFSQVGDKDNAIPTDYNRIREIGKRYDTRYVSVMLNRNLIKKRKGKEYLWGGVLAIVFPYAGVPFLISRFFHDKEFVYVVAVIDMYEGKLIYGNAIQFHRQERSDLFKSQFYATLIELKGRRK